MCTVFSRDKKTAPTTASNALDPRLVVITISLVQYPQSTMRGRSRCEVPVNTTRSSALGDVQPLIYWLHRTDLDV